MLDMSGNCCGLVYVVYYKIVSWLSVMPYNMTHWMLAEWQPICLGFDCCFSWYDAASLCLFNVSMSPWPETWMLIAMNHKREYSHTASCHDCCCFSSLVVRINCIVIVCNVIHKGFHEFEMAGNLYTRVSNTLDVVPLSSCQLLS